MCTVMQVIFFSYFSWFPFIRYMHLILEKQQLYENATIYIDCWATNHAIIISQVRIKRKIKFGSNN